MKYLILTFLLTSCASVAPQAPIESTPVKVETPSNLKCADILKTADAGCPKQNQYGAIDMATYGNKKFYELMSCLGVKTIIRYYDWPGQETLRGKIPNDAEVEIINSLGFDRLNVFQHNNNKATTFTSERGRIDAGHVLTLAKKWKQPKGSAVYFGVDGDFETSIPVPYFKEASSIIRAAGYKIGMYGSGANCENLKKLKLIDGDLCWIAASSWGWRGTKDILAKNSGFALKQKVNQKCLNLSLDYNTVLVENFGQWKP